MIGKAIQTVVSRRGQTVVPAQIRRRHRIEEGDSLVWLDDGETIRLIHLRGDAIDSLRGSGRGEGLGAKLLEARERDRNAGS